MGLKIGFNFYKKISCDNENKTIQLAPISVKELASDKNYIDFFNLNIYENTMFICGRNTINSKIADWVYNKTKHSYGQLVFSKDLNEYTIVGFKNLEGDIKLFSADIGEVYKALDFDNVKINHELMIENTIQQIDSLADEVEILRTHQEVARTKIAFDGFQEQIDKLKERINNSYDMLDELENDDDDFNLAQLWIMYLDTIKSIMNNCDNIIVTMYASY